MESRAEIIASQLREWMNLNDYSSSDILLGLSRVIVNPITPTIQKVDIEKLLRLTREDQMRGVLRWIDGGDKPFYPMNHRLYSLWYDVERNVDRVWRKELLAMIDDYLNGRTSTAVVASTRLVAGPSLLRMCDQSVLVVEVMWVVKSMDLYQCIYGEAIDARNCIDVKPNTKIRECIEKYLKECLLTEESS